MRTKKQTDPVRRNPISKKIRFEVFKRDGFVCQYCGKHPPDVILEVDHLHPVSKNGTNDLNNLITSCFDCNRGKGKTELKQIPNTLVENKEILEERENQYIEYHKLLAKIDRRVNKEIAEIEEVFVSYFPKFELTNLFRKQSLKKFINSLDMFQVKDAMEMACSKFQNSRKQNWNGTWYDAHELAIKYFCGICWKKIKENG